MRAARLPNLRNISTVTVLFGVVLLLFIWTGLYFKVQSERQLELDNVFKETDIHVRMFEEHTVRALKDLDQIALFLKYQVEKEGGGIDIPRLVRETKIEDKPFLLLSLTNETGDVVASSKVPFVSSNIVDREHFLVHREVDTKSLFISKPVLGRSSGKVSIQLTRRINNTNGTFGGIVVVSVGPSHFTEYYKQATLGENSSIALIGCDGFVRVRQTDKEIDVGHDLRQKSILKRLSTGNAGNFTAPSAIDGVHRIYSFRALSEYPLVVTVGVSEAQAFYKLNQRIVDYYWVCGTLSVIIIVFFTLLLSSIARRRQAEEALRRGAEIQTILREIAEAAILSTSMAELFTTVHHLVGRMLPANLFLINLLDEENGEIVVPFRADDVNYIPERRPFGKGLTEYIMRLGRAAHLTSAEMVRLRETGEYTLEKVQKSKVLQYLGAPLIDSKGKAFGVMSMVLMDKTQTFLPEDVEVLSIIAAHFSLSVERKRAEDALRESEEKYRKLFEIESDALFLIDNQNGKILDANLAAVSLYGYSLVELRAMRNVDLSAEPKQTRKASVNAGSDKVIEIPLRYHRKKDGTVFPVEINATSLLWKGRPAHIPVIRDITERKRAEDVILASQQRYRALVEQSSEALALVDMDTQEVVEVNRRFTELLGYSLPIDAPLNLNTFVIDSKGNLDRIFKTQLAQQPFLPTEARIVRHKNGTEVPVERAGTVISLEGRDYLFVSMRDMTAERRRQAELSRDAEFARKVQRGLLPELPDSPLADIRTIYHPSHFVSGDSYHLEWRNEGKLLRGFLIDVSGHGLATALQTASINVLLREVSTARRPLRVQIRRINAGAAKYFADGAYAALLGFELDFSQQELRFVGAGITHFYANGKKIETPGMFVGLWENAEFTTGKIKVAEGDSFYFLTDGFTDALAQPENQGFLSADGKGFDSDVAALERLAESGKLRDDATGICLNVKKML